MTRTGCCIVLLLSLAWSHPADAIIARHDRDAVASEEQTRRYRAVGKVLPDGEAVLIDPHWVLTAAHVATGAPGTDLRVRFLGIDYLVAEIHPHPHAEPGRHDIALMRLERPVSGVEPLAIDLGGDLSEGAVILIAGRGDHGDGRQGIVGNDGRLRVAENAISRLEAGRLEVRLDRPGDGALPAEGISGPGDSGTPALGERDGRLVVVGIGSVGRSPKGERYGLYGSSDVFILVEPHIDWLTEVLATPSD